MTSDGEGLGRRPRLDSLAPQHEAWVRVSPPDTSEYSGPWRWHRKAAYHDCGNAFPLCVLADSSRRTASRDPHSRPATSPTFAKPCLVKSSCQPASLDGPGRGCRPLCCSWRLSRFCRPEAGRGIYTPSERDRNSSRTSGGGGGRHIRFMIVGSLR